MEKFEVIDNSENAEEFINSSLLTNDGHGFIIHRDDIDGKYVQSSKNRIPIFVLYHTLSEEILTGDTNDGENSNHEGSEDKSEQPLREQDRFLPIANIAKIMKRAIPETGKVIYLWDKTQIVLMIWVIQI